jgi:hypothetical protein
VNSQPPGCIVRLNGVQQGETPFALDDVAQGIYRLQVECDPDVRGRVYRAQVTEGLTEITVDSAFDEHVDSRPIVHIQPSDESVRIAGLLASRVGARIALLEPAPGGWTLRAVTETTAGNAVALDAPDLIAALEAAVAPEVEEEVEAPSAPTTPLPAWRTYTGVGAAVLGVAGLALGSVFHFQRASAGDRYVIAMPSDIDYLQRQAKWNDLGPRTYAFAALGGVLLGAGAVLGLPEREGVPWWGWVSGALGVGALAGAVVAAVTLDGGCDNIADTPPQCVDRGQGGGRAMLLGMAAVPLLTVPLVYLFGRDPSGSLEVGTEQGGASLRWRGRF